MTIVSIRKAIRSDAKGLTDLLVESQWFTYKSLFSKEYIQKLIEQYYNVQRIEKEIVFTSKEWNGYFIAEIDGEIVGAIGGGMRNDTVGEIYVLYLDSTLLGKKIGTRLLNYYTDIQKRRYGATVQWVSVAKGNNYAIPFYEAREFIYQFEDLSYGALKENKDISLHYRRDI